MSYALHSSSSNLHHSITVSLQKMSYALQKCTSGATLWLHQEHFLHHNHINDHGIAVVVIYTIALQ
jgi:hypothetical protein